MIISDFYGKSSLPEFKDLTIKAYQETGLKVHYNKPYIGGGITQTYGKPHQRCNTIQVELNRSLYMNETTKKLLPDKATLLKTKLGQALTTIHKALNNRN